jgi:hypothetical protein
MNRLVSKTKLPNLPRRPNPEREVICPVEGEGGCSQGQPFSNFTNLML